MRRRTSPLARGWHGDSPPGGWVPAQFGASGFRRVARRFPARSWVLAEQASHPNRPQSISSSWIMEGRLPLCRSTAPDCRAQSSSSDFCSSIFLDSSRGRTITGGRCLATSGGTCEVTADGILTKYLPPTAQPLMWGFAFRAVQGPGGSPQDGNGRVGCSFNT